nr:Transmembrane protein 62 [Polyrhizophydium stewartii]
MVVLVALALAALRGGLYLYDASMADLRARTAPLGADASAVLATPPQRSRSSAGFSDSADNVMHFMQVSDLHVSRFRAKGGIAHLGHFLQHEMNLIGPDLVLATGDLTDAKSKSTLNSQQHREEWVAYHTMLEDSGVLKRQQGRFWWDQRGNHDCFNIPSFASSENMFRTLSAVKQEGYAFHLRKPFGVYSFIAVDACPEAGATRPINFFGYLDTKDMDFLASQILVGQQQAHNHTFVMSHYPTSTMLFGETSDGLSFWDISHHISVWLCGHLHKLAGGLGETMYAFQDNHFLELELADLKSHATYRIVVVDHDLVSFLDLPLFTPVLPIPHQSPFVPQTYIRGRPPIVLVTNPKDGRFVLEGREPVEMIRRSRHIRVFVWSERPIERVQASIDGDVLLAEATYRGRGKPWKSLADEDPHLPLWTIPWSPVVYDDDHEHTLIATAWDSAGASTNYTVVFRVDGQRIAEMDTGVGGAIIGFPFGLLFKDLFVIGYLFVSIGFLLIPKLFVLATQILGTYDTLRRTASQRLVERDTEAQEYLTMARLATPSERLHHTLSDFAFTTRATFFRFCEMATYPSLFYPLFLFNLYLLVGPWFVGEFVPSAPADSGRRYGWMMVYGIWFQDGTWTPLLDNWLFAFYGIVYSVLPLEMYLSFCCTSPALLYAPTNPRHFRPIHRRWYVHLMVVVSLMYHLGDSLGMATFYGPISAFVSPAKTWLTLWAAAVLWAWRKGPHGTPAHGYAEVAGDEPGKAAAGSGPQHVPGVRMRRAASGGGA